MKYTARHSNLTFLPHSGSCGVGFVCNIKGTKSHEIIAWGIEAVKNLTHRGAVGADGKTGDGAGVLFQIPQRFFLKEIGKLDLRVPSIDDLAVGFFFLWENIDHVIEEVLKRFGFIPVGWRDVPTDDEALGEAALSTKPHIRQLFIDAADVSPAKRELKLYLARRTIEKECESNVYVASLSSKTIIYKGMLVATHLDHFYPDLTNREMDSAFCVFHQRFSTNTLPDWSLAQPFRVLSHNGEINTIQGNRNWMVSMEEEIRQKFSGPDESIVTPLIAFEESDSASLDRVVELLMLSGFSPEHAINMCIPPVLDLFDFPDGDLRDKARAFFEYQSFLMKPWDGPAAIVFTDGETVGAHLDRNGLRPLRYTLTEDGIIILGSETGMIDLRGRTAKEKGRLGPGETISVNVTRGDLRFTPEILQELSGQRPYKKWTERFLVKITKENTGLTDSLRDITRMQVAFGYTSEEIETVLKENAQSGKEMTHSMGDDTPLPSLSNNPQLLFRYFRQRFSQVTNPPIDHIRERPVMSLKMNLGFKRSFLDESPEHARRLHLNSPILLEDEMKAIADQGIVKVEKIAIAFSRNGSDSLSEAVKKLQGKVIRSVEEGNEIIILSDVDVSRNDLAIPSLLAVSACFKALQKKRLSNRTSLVLETGEARDVHHMACLIGYNASAVYPYLAYQTIREMCERGRLNLPYEQAVRNYKRALEEGLLKVISKMGISTLNSYYGAQLFDSICLNRDFIDEFFTGTAVSLEGDGMPEIERSLRLRHAAGFKSLEPSPAIGGVLRYRKGGELHAWSPPSVTALRNYLGNAEYPSYREFSRIADETPITIKHLLGYKGEKPLAITEVEPVDDIVKRFFSGAMSVGSLSPEAHETIAEACNRLGIRSNSGEGGENPLRYWGSRNSAIKQIASGRFGVTPVYIASARELEIKVAQGAKPGEGGHLPAIKVTDYIASLRHCKPHIILISPPPHHDIYSIEDLAQLIHDLKQANPEAKICVKLVSESGVGTVAAGVAKAYADIVQICGCEGGTGAASVSSIKNAGNYWEIGLVETQRVLMENGLRERIRLRVDGGFRTGRDVIIAALLGAEEFGFGTATMVAAGCIMARQCHLNTCPTGVASQDKKLRERFKGRVEDVMAYFTAVAQEVREILAGMGKKSLDEIIANSDLLSPVLTDRHPTSKCITESLIEKYPSATPKKCIWLRNDNPAPSMNDILLKDLLPYIEKAEPVEKEYRIRNVDRSIPLKLNYHISLRHREEGLPPDTIRLTFRGVAGQSFGAFNHKGLSLTLIGDANDYAGKGMFGGKIIIRPGDMRDSHLNVIIGNTVLYGATGGEFYAAGKAGERFAVRNSGAAAVVEGTGHHLCEYMTKGLVIVLGDVGFNIGAGMTGGVLYIYDEPGRLRERINRGYVTSHEVKTQEESEELKTFLERFHQYTASIRAGTILDSFDRSLKYFKKVIPVDNQR